MTTRSRLPERRVASTWRRVGLQLLTAALFGLAAGLAGLLVLAWSASRLPAWGRPSALPLLAVVATAVGAGWWIARTLWPARRWSRVTAAADLEEGLRLSRGSLRGALERGVSRPGTSDALVELQRQRLADVLESKMPGSAGGRLSRRAGRRALGAAGVATLAVAAALLIGVLARGSASSAWGAVFHPLRHLSPVPLPPIQLRTDLDRVRRGQDLPVVIEAPGRDSVELRWRARGMPVRARWLPTPEGTAAGIVPRIDAPTLVYARGTDGLLSDTLRVEPVDPLLLIDLQLQLDYPAHTRRGRGLVTTFAAPLTVPGGTRVDLSARTTLPVASARLGSADGSAIDLRIEEGRNLRRSFQARSGSFGWDIVGAGGEGLEGETDSLRIAVLPDSVPRVEILYPGVDTVMPLDLVQPLSIEARDDYGISRVELVSWRVSAWGEAWPAEVQALEVSGDPSRASLSELLDANGRGLLPGDTLRYFARAYDNAPRPGIGRTREYVLRLPTLDEVRDEAVADAQDLVRRTEELAESARAREQDARALERSTQSQPAPGAQRREPAGKRGAEFRETEAARRALEETDALLQEARQVQESLRQLQESIERAGLNDSSVLERLREIESLFEQILTPELEERLEALRQALHDLDQRRLEEAISRLAEGSTDFRERLERSLELLRRAALEQEFSTLETQAEELAEAQRQLAESAAERERTGEPERSDSAAARRAGADSTGSAVESGERSVEEAARSLSSRAEELAERVRELGERLQAAAEPEAADKAREGQEAAGEVARSDRDVVRQSAAGQRSLAASSARRAASQAQQAASALRQGRQGMQQSWRREVAEALQRAQTETMELARRQQELSRRLSSGDPTDREAARSEQVAMKRAVDQMAEQLQRASESSLLIDPSVVDAAAEIGQSMEELLGQMSAGTRPGSGDPQLGDQAAEALNELAYRLMQAADAASTAESGTGLQEALGRLAELAEQQGQLNAQTGGMTPGQVEDALMQELMRLAGRQRAIAEQLDQIGQSVGPRGQVLGRLDELAREAEELAEELRRGRLDSRLVERQERLFQRLLDAGRTLERDEFEKERRAERPGLIEALRPGELPADVLRGPAFPLPTPEQLEGYPPPVRRLILEYFDRLNGRGGGGGGS